MALRVLVVCLVLLGVMPSVARADGLFIPFWGYNFGGDSGQDFSAGIDSGRSSFGASIAWMGAGVFGFEGDFGYSPDFYGKTDASGSGAFTVTGNVLIGVPLGGQKGFGVRPYGLIGVGVIQSSIDSVQNFVGFDNTDGAWDVGGGVMVFFSNHWGARGEVRYFRTFSAVDILGLNLTTSDNVDFARGSGGLIVRF